MKSIFSKFLYLFNRREKLQILALFFLILIGALLETFVVGLIYPFISILKSPEIIQDHKVLRWIYCSMWIKSTKQFLIWASVGLIGVYLFKNIYGIFLAYVQTRFIFNKQISFSRRLFAFYLNQHYNFYLQRNTAELLHKINILIPTLFNGFLLYVVMFAIEIINTTLILCLLIWVSPLPSIIVISVLCAVTIVFYRIIRKKIGEFGRLKQFHSEQMIQWVNQGLGGIKEIKILGREGFFVNAYDKNSSGYVRAERFIHVVNQLPRPFLETICITVMLLMTLLIIVQNKEFQSIVPTLSLFVVAAFRIIPSMNRIFAATTQIRYNSYSLDAVYNDLTSLNKPHSFFERGIPDFFTKITVNSETSAIFNKVIEIKNIYYQYPGTENPALNNISLTIPKQYSIGFVGPSGAGKTTIVDVILGLLTPTQGEVLVDGKNIRDNLSGWQRQIAYIPQSIYLCDDTIRRNVAFGLFDVQIDDDRVWSALESAQLENFVNSLPAKLDTFIGERGIRFSGGQRQCIGIARALYHNPELLVMDEGTASLDNETEWEVMQAIRRLSGKKTVIIIAHRLSTVKNCDKLYFIKDSKVIDSGMYDELLDRNMEFKAMVTSSECE